MKIELTETEIIHIMDSLRMRVNDMRDEVTQWGGAETADLANELEELEHDLFEASARPGDWTEDLEPTEIGEGFSFSIGCAGSALAFTAVLDCLTSSSIACNCVPLDI